MNRPLYRHPGPAAATLAVAAPDQADATTPEIDMVRWLAQMRADLAETLGGVMLRSVRPVPLSVLPTLLSSSPGRLVGWSLHETTGSGPFVIRFRNGIDWAQDLVAVANGSAGSADTRWFSGGGISYTEGLYVEVVTGGGLSSAVEGAVYIGAAD